MTCDDLRALQWFKVIVWIVTTLVLDKVIRRRHLSNIVVERADPAQADREAA